MTEIQTPNAENWKTLRFDKINWDLEIPVGHSDNEIWLPYQVVRVYNDKSEPMCHCIGGSYGDNNWYCYRLFDHIDHEDKHEYRIDWDKKPHLESLREFNGEAPVYGVHFCPNNYYRKDEWRKGADCYITRNGKRFYEVPGRDVEYCLTKAQVVLTELQEHPIWFNERGWNEKLIGRKVWYNHRPAIVEHVITDQGCIILIPDRNFIDEFNPRRYELELNWIGYESDVKVDYLDKNVDWFRDNEKTKKWIELIGSLDKKLLEYLFDQHREGKLSDEIYHNILKMEFEKI